MPANPTAPKSAAPRKPGAAAPGAPAGTSNAQAFVDSHRDEGATELFGITELCKEFGITLRALRFYEDKGLLAPRRVNLSLIHI